ncbi:MAG: amidohydrolase family protein [Candidatus Thorarchaeota archaeon]|nr:amidohydrolase family protein [Candidatus Thorarchaeota archaeon]
MTIDIHTHLGPDRMSMSSIKAAQLDQEVDKLIQDMDTNGIQRAVLSPFGQVTTDLCLEAVRMSPDRLATACRVMPRPVDVAEEQIKKYADAGCVALSLDDQDYYPQDPAAQLLVKNAVDRGLPVFIHTYNATTETYAFIDRLSLVHQDGRFMVSHMGGLFGFSKVLPLCARDNVWMEISVTLPRLVESPLRVYLDALAQDLGVRRLVFGSENRSDYEDILASLNMLDINVEMSRCILDSNAQTILKTR